LPDHFLACSKQAHFCAGVNRTDNQYVAPQGDEELIEKNFVAKKTLQWRQEYLKLKGDLHKFKNYLILT